MNLGWGTGSYIVMFRDSFGDTNYEVSPEFDFDAGNWWISGKNNNYFTLNWTNASWNNNVTIEIYYETRDGG